MIRAFTPGNVVYKRVAVTKTATPILLSSHRWCSPSLTEVTIDHLLPTAVDTAVSLFLVWLERARSSSLACLSIHTRLIKATLSRVSRTRFTERKVAYRIPAAGNSSLT